MRIPCYEHTIHRFAAPRNTPWNIICADGRSPRVALRRSLMPALLPEGDEFRMNSLRNFLEFHAGEVHVEGSSTLAPRPGEPALGGSIIRPRGIIGVLCMTGYEPPRLYIRQYAV